MMQAALPSHFRMRMLPGFSICALSSILHSSLITPVWEWKI